MLAVAWNWRERPNMHLATAIFLSIEKKGEFDESGTVLTFWSAGSVPLQGRKTNVQTNTCERSEVRTKVRFILPF
jgi:hypothetical protein